jgi:hypothetical protein
LEIPRRIDVLQLARVRDGHEPRLERPRKRLEGERASRHAQLDFSENFSSQRKWESRGAIVGRECGGSATAHRGEHTPDRCARDERHVA